MKWMPVNLKAEFASFGSVPAIILSTATCAVAVGIGVGLGKLRCRTNSDGAVPSGGLVLSNNILYGTAFFRGPSGNGTVFKVKTDGTGFTALHSFPATLVAIRRPTPAEPYPAGTLVLSGNTLYGTTRDGGSEPVDQAGSWAAHWVRAR